MRWLHFILSHSIFISFCAVALCYQTFALLGLPSNYVIYVLVFSCTLCSYNAYWLLSKFHFNRKVTMRRFLKLHASNVILLLLSACSVLICVYLLPALLKFLVVAGVLTLLYTVPLWPGTILKPSFNKGFIKTFLLALTWAYVTTVIPAELTLDQIDNRSVLLFSARLLFMLMLSAIFDSRDSDIDKMRGLKSLATDVSKRSLHGIMLVSFILYIFLGITLRQQLDSPSQAIAFAVTGLAVLIVYLLSIRKQGYVFYYFVVDGLMLFSAIATFVAANV